jgi:hypothetical protein
LTSSILPCRPSPSGCARTAQRRYEAKLPPAILLGADTPVGLTIIRDLGEHGVAVHAVARSREGIGLYSKWATRGYLRPPDEDSTLDLLNRIAAEQGAQFLLAIAERDLLVIRAAADSGRLAGLRPLVPGPAQLGMVLDKSATYAAAREVGVPVPATWQPPEPPGRADVPVRPKMARSRKPRRCARRARHHRSEGGVLSRSRGTDARAGAL